jgi:hypothetical protein
MVFRRDEHERSSVKETGGLAAKCCSSVSLSICGVTTPARIKVLFHRI